MSLSDNVRTLRRRRGLSQSELASRMGVSFSRISEIERGVSNPTVDTLTQLAEALGTTADKLLKIARN